MAFASSRGDGGEGTVDQGTGSSPDPNQISKSSHQTQTVLNEHSTQIQGLQALISKLIRKNNLKL